MSEGGASLGSARGVIRVDFEGAGAVTAGAEEVESGFARMKEGAAGLIESVGKLAVVFGGIEIALKAKEFFQQGNAFAAAINTLGAVSHATVPQLAQARAQAIALGHDLRVPGASAEDAAVAMDDLVKSGVKLPRALAAARPALLLAAAANVDISEAAKVAGDTLDDFKLPASAAAKTADILATAANSTSGGLDSIFQAMKYVGPAAHALDVPLADTTGAIVELGKAGLTGSIAGTGLQAVLTRLAGPTKKQAANMKILGVNAFDAAGKFVGLPKVVGQLSDAQKRLNPEQFLAAVKRAFGTEALKDVVSFAHGGEKGLQGFIDKMKNSGGAAQYFADKTNQGLGAAFKQIDKVVRAGSLDLYNEISPSLAKVADAIGTALPAVFTKIGAGIKSLGVVLVPVFDQLHALFSGLVTDGQAIFNGLKSGLTGTSGPAAAFNSVVISIAKVIHDAAVAAYYLAPALGGVAKAVGSLAHNSVSALFSGLSAGLKGAGGSAGGFSDTLGKVNGAIKSVSGAVRALTGPIGDVLSSAGKLAGDLLKTLSPISIGFSNASTGASGFSGSMKGLVGLVSGVAGALKGIDGVLDRFPGVARAAAAGVLIFVAALKIKGAVSGLRASVSSIGSTFTSFAKQGAIIAGVSLAIYAAAKAYDYFTRNARQASSEQQNFTADLEANGKTIDSTVRATAYGTLTDSIKSAAAGAGVSVTKLTSAYVGQANIMPQLQARAAILKAAYDKQKAAQDAAGKSTTHLSPAIQQATNDARDQYDAIEDVISGVTRSTTALGKSAAQTDEFNRATAKVPPVLTAQQKADLAVAAAASAYQNAVNGVSTAIEHYLGIGQAASVTADQAAEAFHTLKDAVHQNGKEFTGNSEKALANRDALRTYINTIPGYVKGLQSAHVPNKQIVTDLQQQKHSFDVWAKSVGLGGQQLKDYNADYNYAISQAKKPIHDKIILDVAKAKAQLPAINADLAGVTKAIKAIPPKTVAEITTKGSPSAQQAYQRLLGQQGKLKQQQNIDLAVIGGKQADSQLDTTKTKGDKLNRTTKTNVTVTGVPAATGAVNAFTQKTLASIPAGKSTNITATGTGTAKSGIDGVKGAEDSLYDKTITITTYEKHVKSEQFSGAGPQTPAHATGGPIVGAGTGVSDSISLMASNGEYVVKASRARKYKKLLDQINNGTIGAASATGSIKSRFIPRGGGGEGGSGGAPSAPAGSLNTDALQKYFTVLKRYLEDGSLAKNFSGTAASIRTGLKTIQDHIIEASVAIKNRVAAIHKLQKTQAETTAKYTDLIKNKNKELGKNEAELSKGVGANGKKLTASQKESLKNRIATEKSQLDSYKRSLAAVGNYRKELAQLAKGQKANSALGAYIKNASAQMNVLLGRQAKAAHNVAVDTAAVTKQAGIINDLVGKRKDVVNSVSSAISSSASILTTAGNVGGPTAASIVSNYGAQVSKIRAFAGLIAKLRKKGYGNAIIQQITSAGVDAGTTTAQALLKATAGQVKQINSDQTAIVGASNAIGNTVAGQIYDSQIAAAQSILGGLNAGLNKDKAGLTAINKTISQKGTAILQHAKLALGLGKAPKGDGNDSLWHAYGSQVGVGINTGIQTQIPAVQKTILTLAESMKSSIKKALGIKSPSKVFHGFGTLVSQGLADGIGANASSVSDQLTRLVDPRAVLSSPLSVRGGPSATGLASTASTKVVNINQTITGEDAHVASNIAARKLRTMAIAGAFS